MVVPTRTYICRPLEMMLNIKISTLIITKNASVTFHPRLLSRAIFHVLLKEIQHRNLY
jgi:hypothetical protein